MPFIRIDGFDGLVYSPEFENPTRGKHDCDDCAACLGCSDAKCALCVRRSAPIKQRPADREKSPPGERSQD